MIHEWVLIISIYDELKTQIQYFITVAVARFLRTTTCQQAHWTRWSLSQVNFGLKGHLPNFDQGGGDSWRQN